MSNFRPLVLVALLLSSAAAAQDFVPVTDKDAFLALVKGRELRLGVLGIAISINPDGTISGSASGWDLTGDWTWDNGFFCREMDWGGTKIDYNCQLVEARGTEAIRFTVDQGAGQAAEFNLR